MAHIKMKEKINFLNHADKEIQVEYLKEICSNKNEFSKNSKINFKNANITLNIINQIPIDILDIKKRMKIKLKKHYVHKSIEKNMMISDYMKENNFCYFKCKTKWQELNSDHKSDHMDGIKIFEVARQAMLASQHFSGVPLEAVVLLTESNIEYKKMIENNNEYVIQTYTMTRGVGFMHTVFKIFQEEEIAVNGYFVTYVYSSKEKYNEKRSQNERN